MDPILNPFSPGAGSPPPELVGRQEILGRAEIVLKRVKAGKSEKSFLMTGLRGVGKTVLLLEIRRMAEATGYSTISIEAQEDKPLVTLLVPGLRKLLLEFSRVQAAAHLARRALAGLKSFVSAIRVQYGELQLNLDIDGEEGLADSGDLEVDLADLFAVVAEAAQAQGRAVALLIDEVQYLSEKELSALIMAMHNLQQRGLPFVLVGAGLPTLPALAGNSKSYAERLFDYPQIGPLSQADATRAIVDPIGRTDASITKGATEKIVQVTQGYPYFLQEWAYQSWNCASGSPITASDVESATAKSVERLDAGFFRVRYDRCTPSERRFMRAMVQCGGQNARTGDVAEVLGMKVQSIMPVRGQLISKGMIYSPSHGHLSFTVPLFDEFMLRMMPNMVQDDEE